jgi:quinohemoprotein ethanol dehydrogenase
MTGEKVWKVNLGLGISAPPITYTVDGKQYISLLVGWGGSGTLLGSTAAQHGWKYKVHPRRLYTFALDGKTPVPASPPPAFAQPVDPKDFKIDDKLAEHGQKLYATHCLWCHGGGVVSGGATPDLRESPIPLTRDAFTAVVKDGAKIVNGMPAFKEFKDEDVDGLMHYIRKRARESVAAAAVAKP